MKEAVAQYSTPTDDPIARDRKRALEIVHGSPPVAVSLDELQVELLMAKDHYDVAIRHPDQDSTHTPGECVLWQFNLLHELNMLLPALQAHDGLLPLRAGAYALEDYAAGRPGRLNALFPRTPKAVTAGAPSTAAVDAAKIFCVDRLREGGIFGESEATRLVADRVARAGLPGTPHSVHQAYLRVRRSQRVTEYLAIMEAAQPVPADWPQKGQPERKAWLNQITLFEALAAGRKSPTFPTASVAG